MRMSWKVLLLAIVAAALASILFMPFGCVGSSTGDTSCVSLLGLELPGFTGTGPGYPSYWPPVLAGMAAFALVLIVARLIGQRPRHE